MRSVFAHHPFLLNADDWFDHLPGLTARLSAVILLFRFLPHLQVLSLLFCL